MFNRMRHPEVIGMMMMTTKNLDAPVGIIPLPNFMDPEAKNRIASEVNSLLRINTMLGVETKNLLVQLQKLMAKTKNSGKKSRKGK